MQKGPIDASREIENKPRAQSSWRLLARFWNEWMSKRWREILLSLLLMGLLAATTGAYSEIVKRAFNALGTGKPEPGALTFVMVAIAAITFLRALFMYLQTIVTNRTVNRVGVDLQRHVYAHMLAADYERIGRETPGHLISRLTNDVGAVQGVTVALANSSIRDVLTVVAVVGWMIWTDWGLTLLVLGVYPIAALPILAISNRLRTVAKRTQSELAENTSHLTESLSGIRLIKTYRLEDYAEKRTNDSFELLNRLRMKAVITKGAVDPMLEVLAGLALAGVTAFVGYRMSSGVSSIGDFMGFITALMLAAKPIQGFAGLPPKLQEGLAAIERMYELLDEKPRIVDPPGAKPLLVGRGAIQFDHVSFAYGDDAAAVIDFALDVPGGATVALVGASGAGKSTIINLVPRLYDATAGAIRIDGQDVRGVTIASLRDAIALVSQDVTLFNDTVRANIALGRLDASEADIRAAAKAAAAEEFILAMPKGFDTVIGDRGMRLSGGQRQRLTLARAILRNAPILLLDEATSALDTQSERLVQDALAKFSRGRTTLVIAHRLSTVQNADLICVMAEGRIIESGRHRELMVKGGAYAGLVRQQQFTEVG